MFKKKQQEYLNNLQNKNIIERLTEENKCLYLIIGKLVYERKAREDCIGCKHCKKVYDIIQYNHYYPYDLIPMIDKKWVDFGLICTKKAKCKGKEGDCTK